MQSVFNKIFLRLQNSLQELVLLYADFFELLKNERSFLITSDIEKLSESNLLKQALLQNIRKVDQERASHASELAGCVGLAVEAPRLLQLAKKIELQNKSEAATLCSLHLALTQQIEKVIQLNQENENYTQSALRILNGAIEDIKEAAIGTQKKTYGKQGQKENKTVQHSGNFVSKEA